MLIENHCIGVEDLLAAIGKMTGEHGRKVLSKSRKVTLCKCRQLLTYVLRQELEYSWPETAKAMGRTDHTSGMNWYYRWEARRKHGGPVTIAGLHWTAPEWESRIIHEARKFAKQRAQSQAKHEGLTAQQYCDLLREAMSELVKERRRRLSLEAKLKAIENANQDLRGPELHPLPATG